MNMDRLDDSNFLLYAMKHYDNPQCIDIEEFNDDLKRFKYLKRLFSRYKEQKDLKERLILNHIIIIYNLFGVEAATRLLFFRLSEYHQSLKTFLVFLNYMPARVTGVGTRDIISSDIPIDFFIADRLRKI